MVEQLLRERQCFVQLPSGTHNDWVMAITRAVWGELLGGNESPVGIACCTPYDRKRSGV